MSPKGYAYKKTENNKKKKNMSLKHLQFYIDQCHSQSSRTINRKEKKISLLPLEESGFLVTVAMG